ncbi:MAG: Calx-beta domain-containing protein [Verrucomicrobiota bacterium]
MRTVRQLFTVPAWLKAFQLAAWAGVILGAATVLAQPANDNFLDAIPVTGLLGQVTGSNTNATLELGEPTVVATPTGTIPLGSSVWYSWTAPLNGNVTFDTLNSVFDTVLAAYTGSSVSSLTQVAADDDSGPSLTSKMTFTAVQGTTYYISVNGFGSGLFFADEGDYILNWNAVGANWPGQFQLTSTAYRYSQNESFGTASVTTFGLPARATVTRYRGYSGKVKVDYSITSSLYTNIFYTNYFGTIDTNNTMISNMVVRVVYQNFNNGVFSSTIDLPGSITTYSNGIFSSRVTGVVFSNAPFCDIPENWPPVYGVATPPPPATVTFCSTTSGTNFLATSTVPPAFAQGSVIFNDWQMSADIYVPASVPNFAGVNGYLIVTLTNATLDAAEGQTPGLPQIDALNGTATVTFLNTGSVPGATGLFPSTNSIFNFERATLRCNEGTTLARVGVVRSGTNFSSGSSVHYIIDTTGNNGYGRNNTFPVQPGSDYATPDNATKYSANVDFTNVPASGTLTWGANDDAIKFIDIPIHNDDLVEFNEDIFIQFDRSSGNAPQNGVIGNVDSCVLTIVFDASIAASPDANGEWATAEQAAGAVDRSYNPDNYPTTTPPANLHPGANGTVYSVAVQSDSSTIIAGDFTAYNTTPRNRVARVRKGGMLDTSFNPGSGADGFINSVVLDSSERAVLVGGFSSYNGTFRSGIARLTTSGALDNSFDPGFGADLPVYAAAVQPDGQIVIAGMFTTYDLVGRNGIARLNPDGTLDSSFDPGTGPNGTIYSVAVQSDGKIVIAGDFTTVDGVDCSRIARLNADGTLDSTFIGTGFGADDAIYALAIQNDGQILIGGAFNAFNNLGGKGIARLNNDGSWDSTFDVGVGADDIVYSLKLQSDGAVLVGGVFNSINRSRRISFARLTTAGAVDTTFMDTAYNQFAGLVNPYHDSNVNAPNPVYGIDVQPDGNIIIGGKFQQVGGGFSREDIRQRSNVARIIGGATPGSGTISLEPSYTADSSSPTYFVQLTRANGTLGQVSAQLEAIPRPPGPGSAAYGVDYTFNPATPLWRSSWSRTWMMSDGLTGPNNDETAVDGAHVYLASPVYINIISNNNADTEIDLKLTQPIGTETFLLGGLNIPLGVSLGRSSAPLRIVHNNNSAGILSFRSSVYVTNENAGNAIISVNRATGSAGTVTVKYSTTTNGTAIPGVDFTAKSGTLTFGSGQTNQTFSVALLNNFIAQQDRTVGLNLFTPSGGASLGNTNAQLLIVDDDFSSGHLSLSSDIYGIRETQSPAVITVNRLGGSLNVESVTVQVTAGSASDGVNFISSSTVLTWANGDVSAKTVSIPIFPDGLVTPDLTVDINLTNGKVNGTNNSLVLNGLFTSATLVISNMDAVGTVQFSAPVYTVNENGSDAIIPVVRTGGSAESIAVNYATIPGTAFAGTDYGDTSGTLFFGPGEVSKLIHVPIINNGTSDPTRFLTLQLSGFVPGGAQGSPIQALLNITDDESFNQPAGKPDTTYSSLAGFNDSVFALDLQADGSLLVGGDFTTANGVPRQRIARLKPDGTLDTHFSTYLTTWGANATVRSVLAQTDSRILIGGFFTNVNSTILRRIARLNLDGSLDSSFNPGSGANNPIYALGETFVTGQRRIVVGGAFTLFNGVSRNSVAQLMDGGAVDNDFNPGTGANGTIYALAVQPDGKILVGGDFTTFNGAPLNHVARLNPNGSVDTSFQPGSGANDSVRAITVQPDGQILIGGLFTDVDGFALNHLARLNSNGSVDTSFNPGVGADANVNAMAVQVDGRIVVVGDFTRCNDVTRNRITRLNPDGSVDPTINFGTGANASVAAVLIQPDGNIVLGGTFTTYDSQSHPHLVRIYGGSLAGSGSFEFSAAAYQTHEISSNVVVTVRRAGGTSGPNFDGSGDVSIQLSSSDVTALEAINYEGIVTNISFPPGEVSRDVVIPIYDDATVTPTLTFDVALSNPTSPAQLGNQPSAVVSILNDDSGISLSSSTYSVAKNAPGGVGIVNVVRQGGTNGAASIILMTTTNGSAVVGTDYQSVSNVVVFNPGDISKNVAIPVVNNGLPRGNRTVTMILTNLTDVSSNGANLLLLPPAEATLTIIDTVQAPGELLFAATNYIFGEASSNAVITVLRTNGSSGTISVSYSTTAGTAAAGVNYTAVSGVLTFGSGEMVKTFNLPLLENTLVQGSVGLTLTLSNPTGGATLQGSPSRPVTIVDNDAGFAFASAAYVVSETAGSVILNVQRLNNASGTMQVSYATTNGSAIAGTNYQSTSGVLTFNVGETNKSINIPVLHDLHATSNLTFGVNLSNPTGGGQLTFPSSASVIVLDAEAGLGFTSPTFTVTKSGTNAILTVFCSNPSAEPLAVNYASADGTAVAGTDYTPVSGTLSFTNGAVTNYIIVPIINNALVQGDLNFTVSLSGPTGAGQLISPSTATVTIVDINAGLSFSSPSYTVFKNAVTANINVFRTGYTNSTVSVNYATLDGSGTNGIDYTAVSGTLVFTNGQTNLSFSVPVTDSTTVQPDKTVLLQLSNPIGTNGVLVAPSAAVLTIRDNSGSLIVPAGVALLTESGPVNGVIDPGESVSLLFALRNGGGTNTSNLKATLLATNGVTSPSGTQNYGTLAVGGASASRQYSFIASGSNGQAVVATFLLTNGTASAGSATFTFILGNSAGSFTNAGAISIPLQGAASPYPSTINVSGVGGSLTKATVTLNKLTHTSGADIDALLVSPTGQKTLLMANAGGFNAINGATLTFDDAAAAYLPLNSQITTGTNKPTTFFPVTIFPAPAPAAPYNTNLSTLNGSNPNGTWSLYVLDDTALNSGMISNGWSLNLTTVNLVGSTVDLLATASGASSVIVSNNLTYTLTVTNYGPSTATGVTLTDTLPVNVNYVSSNPSLGSVSVVSGVVTWSPGTLAINTGASLTLVVNPTAVGSITNTCTVAANEADANTVNNTASVITTVDTTKADLVLTVVGTPNPLWGGNNVTYSLLVTNAGPAAASGVAITNILSPSVIFVSAFPGGYTRSGSTVTFTNLGTLAVGGQAVASIVVKTTTGGTITNIAVAASQVVDPAKANNSAIVKTVVDSLDLGVFKSGSNLVISWPTNTAGYVLESATNLISPVWTTVTSPTAVVSNGQYVITISVGSGSKYFRLHGP